MSWHLFYTVETQKETRRQAEVFNVLPIFEIEAFKDKAFTGWAYCDTKATSGWVDGEGQSVAIETLASGNIPTGVRPVGEFDSEAAKWTCTHIPVDIDAKD